MRLTLSVSMIAVLLGPLAAQDAKKEDPEYKARPANAIVYTKDIAPIVYSSCASCHRPGEVAPFSLLSYADLKKRAKEIVQVTQARTMPVWKPEPGCGDFLGDRRLSKDQIGLIKQWAGEGCAEGDAKDLPPAPKFPEGWALGEPDLVVKMSQSYTLPGEGRDVYRNFAIALDLTEDKYVRAVEYRPSNRKIVHHALMFLDTSGESRRKDGHEKEPGFSGGLGLGAFSGGGLGGWAPGGLTQPMPDGVGKQVKKGADLLLQLHFHPSGKPEKEQSTIGLYFCKEKPAKLAAMLPLAARTLDIPAGEKAYRTEAGFTTPVDFDLIGIVPHAHYLGKEMKVTATLPEGKEQVLIWIKDWDFDWQEQYRYAKAVKIPKGTTLSMVFTFDNSAENPKNPSTPPRRVRWGEQTVDEMALSFLQIVPVNQGDYMKIMAALAMQMGRKK